MNMLMKKKDKIQKEKSVSIKGKVKKEKKTIIKKINKKEKVKVLKKENKNKKPKGIRFRIRYKIAICFIVPIIFMIIVGTIAYQKAAEGMSDKYRESTQQTVNMATSYINMTNSFIEAEALTYAFDTDLSRYYLGLYEDDPLGKLNVISNAKTTIMSSQSGNQFISGIHIITKNNIYMMSRSEERRVGKACSLWC